LKQTELQIHEIRVTQSDLFVLFYIAFVFLDTARPVLLTAAGTS